MKNINKAVLVGLFVLVSLPKVTQAGLISWLAGDLKLKIISHELEIFKKSLQKKEFSESFKEKYPHLTVSIFISNLLMNEDFRRDIATLSTQEERSEQQGKLNNCYFFINNNGRLFFPYGGDRYSLDVFNHSVEASHLHDSFSYGEVIEKSVAQLVFHTIVSEKMEKPCSYGFSSAIGGALAGSAVCLGLKFIPSYVAAQNIDFISLLGQSAGACTQRAVDATVSLTSNQRVMAGAVLGAVVGGCLYKKLCDENTKIQSELVELNKFIEGSQVANKKAVCNTYTKCMTAALIDYFKQK